MHFGRFTHVGIIENNNNKLPTLRPFLPKCKKIKCSTVPGKDVSLLRPLENVELDFTEEGELGSGTVLQEEIEGKSTREHQGINRGTIKE